MTDPSPTVADDSSKTGVDSRLMLSAGRHALAATTERALFERCELEPGRRILIGCSGGADSSALAALVGALAARRDSRLLPPVLCHVDHGIRIGSEAEGELVRALASRLGVPFRGCSLGMDPNGTDLAATARRLRYSALHDVACEFGILHVACAHHAEDRLETLLHGLCRGSGAGGLSNPRWRRRMGDVSLLRPLLGVSREELRDFCRSLHIEFVDDPTNHDVGTVRGSLRDSVLPRLEERWPGAARRASAAVDRLSVAFGALDRELVAILESASSDRIDLSKLATRDPGFIAALVRKWALAYAAVHGHDLTDHISSSFFEDVARAVCDDDRRPRQYQCGGLFLVMVDARSLSISLMPSS